jgi:branched-chain amino acid transport system permease protein
VKWAGVLVVAVVLVASLLVLPRLVSSYALLTVTRFLVLALMAQGWNFIGGYTGYAAFGNVAYFGIGAYATGLLMLGRWHLPFFPALAAGALLAALVAMLIGPPILRLKGHYFAIATLGVAEALAQVADNWDSVTEGSSGIDLPVRADGVFLYYTAAVLVLLGIGATWAFARSKLGYGCVAIREDQVAARMLGVNTTFFKGVAYALSAVFAALAGGITAYQNVHVTPTDFFRIDYTLEMIIACIIGGPGTILGPVVGAGLYEFLSTFVWSRYIELHPTLLGLIIVFFVMFMPRGLLMARRGGEGQMARPFRPSDLLANIRANRIT